MAARRKFAVCTPHGLNVRESPSYEAGVLRILPEGEAVTADREKTAPEGWVAVKGGGYVRTEFLM